MLNIIHIIFNVNLRVFIRKTALKFISDMNFIKNLDTLLSQEMTTCIFNNNFCINLQINKLDNKLFNNILD